MQPTGPSRDLRGDPVLVVASRAGFARPVALGTGTVIAGRDPDLPLAIADESVSRRHAEFRAAPLAVRDLGSTNGTRAQGRAVGAAWTPLEVGAVVELGDAVVLVRTAGADVDDTAAATRPADPGERVVVDPAMQRLYALVDVVAPSRMSVLVLGETGVGKEVVAQALHRASRRRAARLLTLNCAAISSTLLEGELFGYEKGAFTGAASAKAGLFEAAGGGTVFLDEIGELPLDTQAKLLRVLESGEVYRLGALAPVTVDLRIVAATHRDLAALAAQGKFRLDLLFRLSGVTLAVPALRDRPLDIVPLARHFLAQVRGADQPGLTTAAEAALATHPWPGNVRELKHTVERAELFSQGGPIDAVHLTFGAGVPLGSAPAGDPRELPDEIAALERARILAALDACGGNQTRAARELGISRATLIRRLERYGVARPRG